VRSEVLDLLGADPAREIESAQRAQDCRIH
jgi:hypothetical protein